MDQNLRQFMSFAQNQMEACAQAAQRLFACRSVEEAQAVQNDFLQQSFDSLVAQASQMTQNAAGLAKETAEPLGDGMEKLMQSLTGRAA